jgi:hypothetical protein
MSRTYSREEIAALMERAAEIQQQRPAGDADGLTLAELEEVAQSAGISTDALRAAAAEFEPRRAAPTGATDTQVFAERVVPLALQGDALPAWVEEEVVLELRRRYDGSADPLLRSLGLGMGEIERVGRTVEWRKSHSSGAETRVQLRPRSEGVQLSLSRKIGWAGAQTEAALYGAMAAILPALVALIVARVPLVVVVTYVVSWFVLTLLIRGWIGRWRAGQQRYLDALADLLVYLTADAAPPSSASERTGAPPARPLLDDTDDLPDGATGRSGGIRSRE